MKQHDVSYLVGFGGPRTAFCRSVSEAVSVVRFAELELVRLVHAPTAHGDHFMRFFSLQFSDAFYRGRGFAGTLRDLRSEAASQTKSDRGYVRAF